MKLNNEELISNGIRDHLYYIDQSLYIVIEENFNYKTINKVFKIIHHEVDDMIGPIRNGLTWSIALHSNN
jgi:hypothetical protein